MVATGIKQSKRKENNMPELPEVETIKRTLAPFVIGKTIEKVEVNLPRIIQYPDDKEEFKAKLRGETIIDLARRGKYLLFHTTNYLLLSHLRMEGRYGVYKKDEEREKHTHVIFTFTDGTELRYKDVRKFGTMHLYEKNIDVAKTPLAKLGLEPLANDLTFELFKEKYQEHNRKARPIKNLLLEQTFIAGLGNIYVDEVLFLAKISPTRSANSVTDEELKKLYTAIRTILTKAINLGGSSIKSYVNGLGEIGMFQNEHQVYQRDEEPCYECNTPIMKIRLNGRGTHYCPTCQK